MTWLEFCNGLAQLILPIGWLILAIGVAHGVNRYRTHVMMMEATCLKQELMVQNEAYCEDCPYMQEAADSEDEYAFTLEEEEEEEE